MSFVGGKTPYEHVRAKTRGIFSFHSNALDADRTEVAAMRVQRRGECGWASSIHKPYRPLGTPDVLDQGIRGKLELTKDSSASHNAVSSRSEQDGLEASTTNGSALNEDIKAGGHADANEYGLVKLRSEIKNSNLRRIGCRSGSSFLSILSKQSPESVKIGHNLLQNLGGSISSSVQRQLYPVEAPTEAPTEAPASNVLPTIRSPEKRLPNKNSLELNRSDKSNSLIQFPSLPGEGNPTQNVADELPCLDPSTSMGKRLKEFKRAKTDMNKRLATKLNSLTEERFDVYKRKLQSFRTSYHTFSSERWELEAAKMQIRAKLNALIEHKWYFKFVQFFETASRPSHVEKVIMKHVKDVVEEGIPYERKDFQHLLELLPKRAYKLNSVLTLLNILRTEIGIGEDEYKLYLKSCQIIVPSLNKNRSISKSKRQYQTN